MDKIFERKIFNTKCPTTKGIRQLYILEAVQNYSKNNRNTSYNNYKLLISFLKQRTNIVYN